MVTIYSDPHSSFIVVSLGLGDSSPGMFLAHHRSNVGPYFGSIEENNWPSAPLRKKPLPLEARWVSSTPFGILFHLTVQLENSGSSPFIICSLNLASNVKGLFLSGTEGQLFSSMLPK